MGGLTRGLLNREAAKLFDHKEFVAGQVFESEALSHNPRMLHSTPDTFWNAFTAKLDLK